MRFSDSNGYIGHLRNVLIVDVSGRPTVQLIEEVGRGYKTLHKLYPSGVTHLCLIQAQVPIPAYFAHREHPFRAIVSGRSGPS